MRFNWFVAGTVLLYYGAAVKSYGAGNLYFMGLWLCYGTANVLLILAELKGE